jgi:hypothetical protein
VSVIVLTSPSGSLNVNEIDSGDAERVEPSAGSDDTSEFSASAVPGSNPARPIVPIRASRATVTARRRRPALRSGVRSFTIARG